MKLFLLMMLVSFNLFSQSTDPRQDKNHACTMDFPLHCKDEVPSDSNYWGCLGKKMNMLSPKCSEFMEGVYLRLNACGKEILALCPGQKKNYGNWSRCLSGRKSEVSSKCAKKLNEIEGRYNKWAEVYKTCEKERAKHCGSLEQGACMGKVRNLPESELSSECKAKLSSMK